MFKIWEPVSVDKFLNTMRMQANMASNDRAPTQLGIVTSVDTAAYLVTVQIHVATPDEPAMQTGWIPIVSPWVGNGWGLVCPPSQGDLVEVQYQEASLQNPICCNRLFPAGPTAPNAQSGEFYLVHQSGSFLKFTNDGKVSLSSGAEIDIAAPIININSVNVRLGNISGPLQPILLADDTPSVNVSAT